jgi:transcriptional regulator with XRE-family HTH domain
LKEAREGLGVGLRQLARESGVSVSTLQDTEGGRTPRPQTAMKYAEALRRRGLDPSEVAEIRDALGEVFFVDTEPGVVLLAHAMRAWDELTRGLVRAGHDAEELGVRLRRIAAEHGEEATQVKEARDRANRELVAEETAREREAER